jgi:rhodanese-related sulfurtransferase
MALRTKTLPAFFALASLVALGGGLSAQPAPTTAPAPTYPASIGQMVAKTKTEVKAISMADFKAALDRKDTGLLIDVRNENEFEDGHIAGAVNVPRGLVEFRIWKLVGFPDKIDMNTKMTIYCATGGRSALATKTLREMGFTNVTAVDLKFEDWVKAGHPVDKM